MRLRPLVWRAAWLTLGLVAAFAPAQAVLQPLARVSVDSSGVQGNDTSERSSVSADGRYVAFQSRANNLVAGDTNDEPDIFVHDTATGVTTRVSVASSGAQANRGSSQARISADGRYVAFGSDASNLVANDTNNARDIFVHDRLTGITTRVSVDSSGAQANNHSTEPSISADGRFVAFRSYASNLVAGDTNGTYDIFVHDRDTGITSRVSVASNGAQSNRESGEPSLSADGRHVAFWSAASNLVADDTNDAIDIFIHDRDTGETVRASLANSGAQGNDDSFRPSISANGRQVAFQSRASNLVEGDTNGASDVFVYDRDTHTITRVSVASNGAQGNGASGEPGLSADGRYVAFESSASNLVAGDTNGAADIFVHDRESGATVRVNLASDGAQADGDSYLPRLTADGGHVAFHSLAKNLVADDTNDTSDVFVARVSWLQAPSAIPVNGDLALLLTALSLALAGGAILRRRRV